MQALDDDETSQSELTDQAVAISLGYSPDAQVDTYDVPLPIYVRMLLTLDTAAAHRRNPTLPGTHPRHAGHG